MGWEQSFNQHHTVLYLCSRTLCTLLNIVGFFFFFFFATLPGVRYVRHHKQMLLRYRNKVCAAEKPQWNRKNQTQHCSYGCFTPNMHTCHTHARTHTKTHTVNREHRPGTAAQTNTLKIQTTHIQTLSVLNELALLRKDSTTTLYRTLIP